MSTDRVNKELPEDPKKGPEGFAVVQKPGSDALEVVKPELDTPSQTAGEEASASLSLAANRPEVKLVAMEAKLDLSVPQSTPQSTETKTDSVVTGSAVSEIPLLEKSNSGQELPEDLYEAMLNKPKALEKSKGVFKLGAQAFHDISGEQDKATIAKTEAKAESIGESPVVPLVAEGKALEAPPIYADAVKADPTSVVEPVPQVKADAKADLKAEPKTELNAEATTGSVLDAKDALVFSDPTQAVMPAEDKNKRRVVLNLNLTEEVGTPEKPAEKPVTKIAEKSDKAETKLAATDKGATNDVPAVLATTSDVQGKDTSASQIEDKLHQAVDSTGKTIGYWTNNGKKTKLVMSIAENAPAANESLPQSMTPEVAVTPTTPTPSMTPEVAVTPATPTPSMMPEVAVTPTTPTPSMTPEVAVTPATPTPSMTPEVAVTPATTPDVSVPSTQAPASESPKMSIASTDSTTSTAGADYFPTTIPTINGRPVEAVIADAKQEAASAAESISATVAQAQSAAASASQSANIVQESAAVTQSISTIASVGDIQSKISAITSSVDAYNAVVASNPATASFTISADVDRLKSALSTMSEAMIAANYDLPIRRFDDRVLGSAEDRILRASTKVVGLPDLSDPGKAVLDKIFERLSVADKNIIAKLAQTSMPLGLTSPQYRDADSPRYTDISTATLSRLASPNPDTTREKVQPDFGSASIQPGAGERYAAAERAEVTDRGISNTRDAIASQTTNTATAQVPTSQASTQTTSDPGRAQVRSDELTPLANVIAYQAGVEAAQLITYLWKEKELADYYHLPLFDYEQHGFRQLKFGGSAPQEDAGVKLTAAIAKLINKNIGDPIQTQTRITSPQFPLSLTLGDKHSLQGKMQGIPALVGGFDAATLARYQSLNVQDLLASARNAQGALLSKHPYLASGLKRSAASYVRPDADLDVGGMGAAASSSGQPTMTLASIANQAINDPQNSSAANQDEEA